MRWFVLVAGIFGLACAAYIPFGFFRIFPFDSLNNLEPLDAVGFTIFWTAFLLIYVTSLSQIALAIKEWHGNVHRMLLLKLLDAQLQQPSLPSAADLNQH
jgi:EamA domain-containing membrane protein RarD